MQARIDARLKAILGEKSLVSVLDALCVDVTIGLLLPSYDSETHTVDDRQIWQSVHLLN